MSKKVFIGVGHGGSDPGAVDYIVEKEYDMNSKTAMCNKYNPDLVVDIHFNAGGGQGFEVYYSVVGGTSKTLANNINEEVKKIMSSRGIKTKLDGNNRDYFAVIRETKAPAVLLEGGFVDNKKDADFIKKNYKKLAESYAKGIVKTLGIKEKLDKLPVMDKTGSKKGDANSAVLILRNCSCLLRS